MSELSQEIGRWLCSPSLILPIGWGQACLLSHRTSVSMAWQIPRSRTYFTTKRNTSPSTHWKRSTMVASKWINAPDFYAISLLLCQLMVNSNTKWGTLFTEHSAIVFLDGLGWVHVSLWRSSEEQAKALGFGQFSPSVFPPQQEMHCIGLCNSSS